jgi:hypothetical protein
MKKFPIIRWISIGLTLSAISAFADSATVILVQGKVMKLDPSGTSASPVSVRDKITPGTTLATGPRSFAKLVLVDNSTLNIGPNSRTKLEPTPANAPAVISVSQGQIRAKITKDPMAEGKAVQTDKLYIKTKSAAMGIRGTEFQVIYNPQNRVTSLVTYEGSVAMTKLDPNIDYAPRPDVLRQELSPEKTVLVDAGKFSGSTPEQTQVSQPVKISPTQLESLKVNENLAPPEMQNMIAAKGSPVPPGVDPKTFAAVDNRFENKATAVAENSPPPEGFFDASSGKYAPRAGGYIDLQTGLYIPPPPGSTFDPAAGVFTPPTVMGGVDPQTGAYLPPPGLALDPTKGFVAAATTGAIDGNAPPPNAPPAAMLNTLLDPTMAGQVVSFGGIVNGPMPGNILPPPPTMAGLPPPPRDPSVSDPFCPTCHGDNVNANIPQFTPLQFVITVQ